jgi:hypothetical protein
MRDEGCQLPGDVQRETAPGASDHDEHAAGAQQVGHASQARSGVHVVQGGDARHEIEALGFERVREQVTEGVVDVGHGMLSGQLEARRVGVEADDVGDPATQFPRELPVTAADVERAAAGVRDRTEYERVVLDVVVPAL